MTIANSAPVQHEGDRADAAIGRGRTRFARSVRLHRLGLVLMLLRWGIVLLWYA